MIFISYKELAADVITWSESLPRELDVIIGVPRSGMLPASILALHRNVRLTTVEMLAQEQVLEGGQRDQHKKIKTGLVIDDSILTGRSLRTAAETLRHVKVKLFYAGVYLKPGAESTYLYHRKVPIPRIFEWNWLHSYWSQRACFDIDGVLCRDPTSEENDDGLRYRKFIHTATPKHIPTVEIHTLVTSRLEKYRIDTAKWLDKYKIRYQSLIMHPAGTKQARMQAGDHAQRKADAYIKSGCHLFVESSTRQAKTIAEIAKRPVLCTATMQLHGPSQ